MTEIPDPIALEDREPHHTDLDDEKCCWWWDDVDGVWEKSGMITILRMNNKLDCPHKYTHWLPHWAIKIPEVKDETDEK